MSKVKCNTCFRLTPTAYPKCFVCTYIKCIRCGANTKKEYPVCFKCKNPSICLECGNNYDSKGGKYKKCYKCYCEDDWQRDFNACYFPNGDDECFGDAD